MIDSHAHIQMFDDVEDVIERAFQNGIKYILCVGLEPSDSEKVIDIAYRFDNIFAAVGIHPLFAEKFSDRDMNKIEKLAKDPKVVAIGETGLDFFKGKSEEKQIELFRAHIHISKKLKKPLVIHTRGALERSRIKDVMKDYTLQSEVPTAFDIACFLLDLERDRGQNEDLIKGVFHCFSWGEDELEHAKNIGLFVSFSGMLTFVKKLREVAVKTPSDILLVETDSPFLSPHPVRGRRNEPANIKFIVEELAKIRKVEKDKIGELLIENFRKLFLTNSNS